MLCFFLIQVRASVSAFALDSPSYSALDSSSSSRRLLCALVQYLFGITTFLYPKASPQVRAESKPKHRFFGFVLAALMYLTLLLGMMNRQRLLTGPMFDSAHVAANIMSVYTYVCSFT